MPKVITRAIVSSSDQATATQSSRAILRSYYCLCGDFLLVMQGKLERLPRRRTDGAYILRSQPTRTAPARKFKLTAQPGDRMTLRHSASSSGGSEQLEIRQLFCCARCKTPVAYQVPAPPVGSGEFVYVLKGAMTELQGRIPPDAFEGEQKLLKAKADE